MSDDMGSFRINIEIENPAAPGRRELLRDVLVDPGAELSWFPAPVLEALEIQRRKVWHFRQADGTILTRWTGSAWIYAAGRRGRIGEHHVHTERDGIGLTPIRESARTRGSRRC